MISKKFKIRIPRALISFGLILLIWETLALLEVFPPYVFPNPKGVLAAFVESIRSRELFTHIYSSTIRLFSGFLLGFTAGTLLGLTIGRFKVLAAYIEPIVIYLQPIPGLAWIPLAILWFGLGDKAAVFIIFNTTFFPVIINVLAGTRSVNEGLIRAALVLGVPRKAILTEVIIPASVPHIITGVRLSVSFGFRALIGGEMLATTSGLGYMIFDARRVLNIDLVVVGMICMGLIYFTLDSLILKRIERKTVEKWGMSSAQW
jgi:ABC-type nitrate/sulfonate/bicarbonate transport system permease component